MAMWKLLLMAVVLTALVVLVMGPGMWSSSNDPVLAKLWRALRGKSRSDDKSGDPPPH
jgi:hypothetical protein